MNDEKSETWGPYTLVARLYKGEYHGVIWKGGEKIENLVRNSVDDCMESLRERVGELQNSRALERTGSSPTAAEAAVALRRIAPKLTQGQLMMLRAHYNAPDRCITATELTKAAHYEGHQSAANLQYGRVGWLLYGELPTPLPRGKDGKLTYTFALAEGDGKPKESDDIWVWKMRPYIAEALVAAGILKA